MATVAEGIQPVSDGELEVVAVKFDQRCTHVGSGHQRCAVLVGLVFIPLPDHRLHQL